MNLCGPDGVDIGTFLVPEPDNLPEPAVPFGLRSDAAFDVVVEGASPLFGRVAAKLAAINLSRGRPRLDDNIGRIAGLVDGRGVKRNCVADSRWQAHAPLIAR